MIIYGAFAKCVQDGDSWEYILDADLDKEVLRTRVNAFFATEGQKNYHRNCQLKIKKHSDQSNEYYTDGGGCAYSKRIHLKELPKLTVE